MKKAGFILLLLSSIFTSKAQTTVQVKQAEQIKEFYTAHCNIWATRPVPSPKKFDNQLDSLQKIYCTLHVRKEAKEWLKDDGHDLITNDWGIDIESLNTLKIVNDPTKENTFVVSYIVVAYPQSPNKPVKQHMVLHLIMTKENGEFKIASIHDSTKRSI